VTSRRANGEGSIFPYRKGFAAYVWITTPSGKRQRKYVYGRTREIVHGRWVELTRKAARGPVVTKVPAVGQFLHRWLEDTVAPNLAPLTYATYESHVKNYIEPGIGVLRHERHAVADLHRSLRHPN
jgi:Phage integrase, N-terminal SAM-like domain